MGQYDTVMIIEGPSNEAAIKGLFISGSGGNIRSETRVSIPAEKVWRSLRNCLNKAS